MTSVLFFLAGLVAFALSSFTGGGAGILLAPLLGSYMPVMLVPVALTIAAITSGISRLSLLWRSVLWPVVWGFVPLSVLGAAAGVWLLQYIDPLLLQFVIGVVLVAHLRALLHPAPEVGVTKTGGKYTVGFAAGVISGLTGAGGLLFNRFFLTLGLPPREIMATRAASEIVLHLVKMALYVLLLPAIAPAMELSLSLALGAACAALVSRFLLPLVSITTFHRMGYAAMVVAGAFTLFQSVEAWRAHRSVNLIAASDKGKFETHLAWHGHQQLALEFAWDKGLELDKPVNVTEVPAHLRRPITQAIGNNRQYLIEEVFSFSQHNYELYIYTSEGLRKYEFR